MRLRMNLRARFGTLPATGPGAQECGTRLLKEWVDD
jgi:hypothetical protein